MLKRKNTVAKYLVLFLSITIVFTSVFSVDVKAETLEENTEFVETEPTETTEETEISESDIITDSAIENKYSHGDSNVVEISNNPEVVESTEEVVETTENVDLGIGFDAESETAEEESKSLETLEKEPELTTEETVAEESATAESNEDAQSDETKDSPAQSRRSRQSQVTRYIYANSIIRSTPNGSVITTLKMPLFVTGTIEGAWLKFTYNGSTAYVANSVTTTNNPPITGYAKTKINVRTFPGRDVIGTVIQGDQVKGVLVGDWVKFTYNGSTGYVYVPLLQDSPIEQRSVYIKAGSNLRKSPNGQVIEKLDMPIYVKANVAGNWLYFQRNNRLNYVYNSNTQTTPLTVTGYLRGDTNARVSPDINSDIYEKLPIGMEISGTMNGNWVEFIIEEYWYSQTCYVHIGTLRKDPIIQVRYVKSDTNVRDYNNINHIVGKMSRGEFIKGRVIGDYIVEQKNGMDIAVYRHILSETPIPYAGYAIPNTNVRNTPNGSVLGKYSQYTYVSGTWQGNWLKIQYQGKTGYIYHSQLRRNTPDQVVTNQTSFTGADGTVVEGTPLTYGEMEQFLALINQHRKNNGASPLVYDYNWLDGGNIRAAEISYEWAHTRPDGSSCFTAVPTEYTSARGENIAWGYWDVEDVFEGWKNSEGHNENMLNPNFNAVMFTGLTLNDGIRTWVTLFSKTEPW